MKKRILFLFVCLGLMSLTFIVKEENTYNSEGVESLNIENVESVENSLFAKLSLSEYKIDSQVFGYAFKGYLKLKEEMMLCNDSLLTIIDYSKPSSEKRMWVINVTQQRLLFCELVAHGKHTGELYASEFSNIEGSNQSSLGFFLTGKTYVGKHPNSLKLHGLEQNINDNAYSRGIVIHGANYVSPSFIDANGRLGRSFGCPSVGMGISDSLVSIIKDGSCIFSYYHDVTYLAKSLYLN